MDLHEGWDIVFYQELPSAPLLPFEWHASQSRPKILSPLLPTGAEGACIMVAAQLAEFATPLPSPCPGSPCPATLHLPRHPPFLTVSVYAKPPRRQEMEEALNILFSRHQRWVLGGDFNASLSSLDTKGKTPNKWNWLSSLIEEKRQRADTFRVMHHDKNSLTRYRNAVLQCNTRIDYFFASKSLPNTPHMSIADANTLHHDTSSDHHPITLTLQLPFTPA